MCVAGTRSAIYKGTIGRHSEETRQERRRHDLLWVGKQIHVIYINLRRPV